MKNKFYTTGAIAILFASAVSLPAEAQRSVDRSTPLLHDVLTANSSEEPEPANAAGYLKLDGIDGESQSAAPGVEPDEIDVLNTARDEGLEPDEIDASNTARNETRRATRRPNRSKMLQDRRARQRQTTRSADEGLSIDADGDGHAISPSALILPAVQSASATSADEPDEGIMPHISTLDGLGPSHPEANHGGAEWSRVLNGAGGGAATERPAEEVTLGYTEVEWTYAHGEEEEEEAQTRSRRAPHRKTLQRCRRRGDVKFQDFSANATTSADDGDTLDDCDEVNTMPTPVLTEDVDGDGDLEVDATSVLTIVRTASQDNAAAVPAPTRVRRGMQELKN